MYLFESEGERVTIKFEQRQHFFLHKVIFMAFEKIYVKELYQTKKKRYQFKIKTVLVS